MRLIEKVLAIIISYLACVWITVYWHEVAHKEIFQVYGIESKVKMNFLWGETIPLSENPNLSKRAKEEMLFLHALNELAVFILFIVESFFFLILTLSELRAHRVLLT